MAVFERHPDPPDGGPGLNLPGNAIATLHALGLGDELASLGTPLPAASIATRRMDLQIPATAARHGLMLLRARAAGRRDLRLRLDEQRVSSSSGMSTRGNIARAVARRATGLSGS